MRLALCTLLLLPLPARAQTCAISGHVGNLLSGGPVRKAKVLVGKPSNPQYEAVTDTNGNYTIAGIVPGRYQLWVQRAGFLPTYFGSHAPNRPGKSLLLAAGDNRNDVNFLLEAPGVITGHIYDQDGEPVSLSIALYRETWRDGRMSLQIAGLANSDDEGAYRLFGLSAGNYLVATQLYTPRPPGPTPTREIYPVTYYPGAEDTAGATLLKVAPGSEARNIDIRIRKTSAVSVTGVLIAETLDPRLRLSLTRRDTPQANLNNVMFPEVGHFAVHAVTPGAYILTANSQSEYFRLNVDVGSLDISGIQLRLNPIPETPTTLKIEGEEPPAGTIFSLTFTSPSNAGPPVMALVDKDRHVNVKGLAPGTWTLDFAPKLPGLFLKSPHEIELGPEARQPLEVIISSRGAAIQGTVQTSPDRPVPAEAATVLLISDSENQTRVLQYAITAMDGTYTFTRIPPGKYRLLAMDDLETNSWDDPSVARQYHEKGAAIELAPSEKATRDLVLTLP